MIIDVLFLIAVTFIPALELRASIPFGILFAERFGIDLSWPLVIGICVVANIALGLLVFWLLAPVMRLLERFEWFKRMIEPIMLRAQKRLHPYVEKYGEFGVAVFIGIPLPGSGVYTGALGAFILGLDRRKFFVANIIGVLIAAAAVGGITLAIMYGMDVPDWLEWIIKKPGHQTTP